MFFCATLDFNEVVTIVTHKINVLNNRNDLLFKKNKQPGDCRKRRIVWLICASNVIGRGRWVGGAQTSLQPVARGR